MLAEIEPLLEEMRRSGLYRLILWAGGYPRSHSTSYSDIDIYAVSTTKFPHHWMMERSGNRRVELTAFTLDEWHEILSSTGAHPKHHYSFIHGGIVHDPENLLNGLRASAIDSIAKFRASNDQLELSRYGVAIQIDKLRGYVESGNALQSRFHAIGAIHAICDLLSRTWSGYALEGAKNLDTVLGDPNCPRVLKENLTTILTTDSDAEMVRCALNALHTTLELTGGDMPTFRGGIPR